MKWITVLAALALPSAALSEVACAPTENTYRVLSEKYGEQRIGMGMMNGVLVEYWANASTGTWSIITTEPTGMSCLVGSGIGFVYEGLRPNI